MNPEKESEETMVDRPVYFRNEITRYVLFLVARVGSTYLTSLLNSHANVTAAGEALRDLEEEGAEAQLQWARDFLNPPLVSRNAAMGFNVKLVHLVDPAAFAELLYEEECKIIHLRRRNRIKAVVSRLNGRRLYKRTGMWGLFDESERPGAFHVDPEEFDEFLKHRERVDAELENYVKSLELPTLNLFYEDLLADEDEFLDGVFTFLNVPAKPVEGKTLKITSDDLRDVLLNFDEIRANYVGTEYEAMFDEVLVPASASTTD